MTRSSSCPALLISAPGSGHGKTSITAGLARYHSRQGLRVSVFKTGPDFLDPMILEKACGKAVRQVDLWMMGETECRRLLFEAAGKSDIILVEGVLGLFDGQPSTADFAKTFSLPVANVVNARGMAQTAHAIAHGLATFDVDINVCGYLINGVNSDSHETMLRDYQLKNASGEFLGTVRTDPQAAIPSRHLGLHQATEVIHLDAALDRIADALAKTNLVNCHRPTEFHGVSPAANRQTKTQSLLGRRIAIARDEAFSFIYAENINHLQELGAHVQFFSPLADTTLPQCDAVYLPGGYPELHAEKLAENQAMKLALQNHVEKHGSIYAECGGMLYLLDSLTLLDGSKHRLCNILPGTATMRDRLSSLGYQTLTLPGENTEIRAHTFHYSALQTDLTPTARATKRINGAPGELLLQIESITATYLHLYFPSCSSFIAKIFAADT